MKRIVTLTENDVKRMIYEAVQEISYGTLRNASQMGLDTERVEKALKDIEGQLEDSASGYKNAEANRYYQAAVKGVEAIRAYFQRKQNQNSCFNDVYDSARSMRNNPDDDEDNNPITQAEYQDADDDRARRAFIKELNGKFIDAVHKKGGWFIPDGVMPRVSNWWTGRQTDKVNVQVYNDYYDKMSEAVEAVMKNIGYNHYDDEDNGTVTVMKFTKVKQQ